MFSTPTSLRRRTGRFGVNRYAYLKQLLAEYEHSSTNDENKLQILANLANFAYDPINYIHLRELKIIDLFSDCLRLQSDDDFVHYALGGLCNMSADKQNRDLILGQKPSILINLVKCLFLDQIDVVLNAMVTLLFLCDDEQIKREICGREQIRECLDKYTQSKDTRLANMAKLFLQEHFQQ